MTALIYDPFTVDDTNLTSTNLTESTSEWDEATTYAAGDEVHLESTKTIYISAIDSNLGNDPSTSDATTWIVKAAMNKWAAFDAYVSNVSSNAGTITYSITVDEIVNGVSFFNLTADSVSITVSKDGVSTEYGADVRDFSYIGGSWYNWFYGGSQKATIYTFANLAYYGSGTVIDIEITVGTGDAEVGQIVLGRGYELGGLLADVDLRNQSYSRFEEDDFGNLLIVKRPVVTLYDMSIATDTGNVARTQRLMKDLMEVPTVFVGSETSELGLILFGVLTSASPTIPHKKMHTTKITFRELL